MRPKMYDKPKDLPKTPFLMIIVTEDNKEHPYYAINIHKGHVTGVKVIEGEIITDLIKQPIRILQLHSRSTRHRSFYIQDKEKKHPGVKCYREFTPKDAEIWKEKLFPLLSQDLSTKNIKDYEQNNTKAKELFVALYAMMG